MREGGDREPRKCSMKIADRAGGDFRPRHSGMLRPGRFRTISDRPATVFGAERSAEQPLDRRLASFPASTARHRTLDHWLPGISEVWESLANAGRTGDCVSSRAHRTGARGEVREGRAWMSRSPRRLGGLTVFAKWPSHCRLIRSPDLVGWHLTGWIFVN